MALKKWPLNYTSMERFEVMLLVNEDMPDFRWAVWDHQKDKLRYRVTDKEYACKLMGLLEKHNSAVRNDGKT